MLPLIHTSINILFADGLNKKYDSIVYLKYYINFIDNFIKTFIFKNIFIPSHLNLKHKKHSL